MVLIPPEYGRAGVPIAGGPGSREGGKPASVRGWPRGTQGAARLSPGPSFRWLHLTDLHQGLESQHWLWPGVREEFFKDLARLHAKSGPWDFVLFTGDLTQRGTAEEFQALDETLDAIWKHLRALGSEEPVLLAVPGNHDLVRPPPGSEALQTLMTWHEDASVRQRFWGDASADVRALVHEAFRPFSEWRARWFERHPPPPSVTLRDGILPGDFSATLQRGDVRLGVVGLNSAFLHLRAGDLQGRLDLDVRQLHGAFGGDAMEALARTHLAFLLTHHPVDWLHPEAQRAFRAQIDAPGRFAAHFFGHMHEGRSALTRLFGFEQQHHVQGASLFGLEDYGEQREPRVHHGYSAGAVDFTAPRAARMRVWPRRLEQNSAGFRHVVQDTSFRLEDEAFSHALEVRAVEAPPTAAEAARAHVEVSAEELRRAREAYKALLRTRGSSPETLARAKQEVKRLYRALREGRMAREGDLLSGRYELLEKVGGGGFGTVWKALDDETDRIVAVKVLHPKVAEDATRRDRFFKGLEAQARLRHPHVVQVLEQRGEDKPYLYAVMEYVPGGDLRAAVRERRLSREQLFTVVGQVAGALAEAHRGGLVHRDVKPGNILLGEQGEALLVDFDLVRDTDSTVDTRTGPMGTFIYAAPEALEPGQSIDARADVFSLGMTVLFCLHGDELPLEAFRDARGFLQRLDCSEPIKAVLSRAVEWERDKRYATVAEFHTELSRALAWSEAAGAWEPRAPEVKEVEGAPRRARRRLPLFVTLGVLALLVSAALLYFPRASEAERYARLLREEKNASLLKEPLRYFAAHPDSRVLEPVVRIASDARMERDVRREALRVIEALGPERAKKALLSLLNMERAPEQVKAYLQVLGAWEVASVEPLQGLIERGRLSAGQVVELVQGLGDVRWLEPLKVLCDGRARQPGAPEEIASCRRALIALERARGEEVIDPFESPSGLAELSPTRRMYVIHALGGDTGALAARLVGEMGAAVLGDEDPWVRNEAAEYLGNHGGEAHRRLLLAAFREPQAAFVDSALLIALVKLGVRPECDTLVGKLSVYAELKGDEVFPYRYNIRSVANQALDGGCGDAVGVLRLLIDVMALDGPSMEVGKSLLESLLLKKPSPPPTRSKGSSGKGLKLSIGRASILFAPFELASEVGSILAEVEKELVKCFSQPGSFDVTLEISEVGELVSVSRWGDGSATECVERKLQGRRFPNNLSMAGASRSYVYGARWEVFK